jgi:hypothetical protein
MGSCYLRYEKGFIFKIKDSVAQKISVGKKSGSSNGTTLCENLGEKAI